MHYGHLKFFEEAKRLGSFLVVSLTADIYVNKGDGRPIFSQAERAYCISRIKEVDAVEVCHHKTALPMIEKWKPDVYCKGADYRSSDKHGNLETEKKAVESHGGKLVITKESFFSSSILIERISRWDEARRRS
jgi:cytidyltransferase-like protein